MEKLVSKELELNKINENCIKNESDLNIERLLNNKIEGKESYSQDESKNMENNVIKEERQYLREETTEIVLETIRQQSANNEAVHASEHIDSSSLTVDNSKIQPVENDQNFKKNSLSEKNTDNPRKLNYLGEDYKETESISTIYTKNETEPVNILNSSKNINSEVNLEKSASEKFEKMTCKFSTPNSYRLIPDVINSENCKRTVAYKKENKLISENINNSSQVNKHLKNIEFTFENCDTVLKDEQLGTSILTNETNVFENSVHYTANITIQEVVVEETKNKLFTTESNKAENINDSSIEIIKNKTLDNLLTGEKSCSYSSTEKVEHELNGDIAQRNKVNGFFEELKYGINNLNKNEIVANLSTEDTIQDNHDTHRSRSHGSQEFATEITHNSNLDSNQASTSKENNHRTERENIMNSFGINDNDSDTFYEHEHLSTEISNIESPELISSSEITNNKNEILFSKKNIEENTNCLELQCNLINNPDETKNFTKACASGIMSRGRVSAETEYGSEDNLQQKCCELNILEINKTPENRNNRVVIEDIIVNTSGNNIEFISASVSPELVSPVITCNSKDTLINTQETKENFLSENHTPVKGNPLLNKRVENTKIIPENSLCCEKKMPISTDIERNGEHNLAHSFEQNVLYTNVIEKSRHDSVVEDSVDTITNKQMLGETVDNQFEIQKSLPNAYLSALGSQDVNDKEIFQGISFSPVLSPELIEPSVTEFVLATDDQSFNQHSCEKQNFSENKEKFHDIEPKTNSSTFNETFQFTLNLSKIRSEIQDSYGNFMKYNKNELPDPPEQFLPIPDVSNFIDKTTVDQIVPKQENNQFILAGNQQNYLLNNLSEELSDKADVLTDGGDSDASPSCSFGFDVRDGEKSTQDSSIEQEVLFQNKLSLAVTTDITENLTDLLVSSVKYIENNCSEIDKNKNVDNFNFTHTPELTHEMKDFNNDSKNQNTVIPNSPATDNTLLLNFETNKINNRKDYTIKENQIKNLSDTETTIPVVNVKVCLEIPNKNDSCLQLLEANDNSVNQIHDSNILKMQSKSSPVYKDTCKQMLTNENENVYDMKVDKCNESVDTEKEAQTNGSENCEQLVPGVENFATCHINTEASLYSETPLNSHLSDHDQEPPFKKSKSSFQWNSVYSSSFINMESKNIESSTEDTPSSLPGLSLLKACNRPRRIGLSKKHSSRKLHFDK